METLIQIFSPMIGFMYHCFDRIVINGYISMLSRPENIVYFFRNVLRSTVYYKGILGQRTKDYNKWIDSYGETIAFLWNGRKRASAKEDYVRPKSSHGT